MESVPEFVIIIVRPWLLLFVILKKIAAESLEIKIKMITFASQTNEGGLNMELQTVKTGKERLIASGASMDGISIRRTGIAKVLWRKLEVDVLRQSEAASRLPNSEVIANGVNIYKG